MKTRKCKLCGKIYKQNEMSEEHYPARSVGNEDIVDLDIVKMFETFQSNEIRTEIMHRLECGESIEDIAGSIMDERLVTSLFPDGRTARTLCKNCNTFLGKYDESYLRFFNADGDPKIIRGFQKPTKYKIIKAIYAKFLSIPETANEKFDFIDFVRDEESVTYNGKWKLYFVKRNCNSDLLGMPDIDTGKATFKEGIVYEMSDNKFIFNLMNFEKHTCFNMSNVFDILSKNYKLVEGLGTNGGYHHQILMSRLLSDVKIPWVCVMVWRLWFYTL